MKILMKLTVAALAYLLMAGAAYADTTTVSLPEGANEVHHSSAGKLIKIATMYGGTALITEADGLDVGVQPIGSNDLIVVANQVCDFTKAWHVLRSRDDVTRFYCLAK